MKDRERAHGATSKQGLWDRFCAAHNIAAQGVPLFHVGSGGAVDIIASGKRGASLLRRSAAMEGMVGRATAAVHAASPQDAEGLLYLMFRLDEQGGIVPLYVGRAGRHGKNGTLVSANLRGIGPTSDGTGWTNGGKFARWGYGYAYHIGDLSCAALPGHEPRRPTPKYLRWAHHLFEEVPSTAPRPRFEARFWCAPWGPASPGIGLSLALARSPSSSIC
jgi:hypothetical protein